MIDIWMVFGLLLPFVEIVLHSLIECRRSPDDNDKVTGATIRASKALAMAACCQGLMLPEARRAARVGRWAPGSSTNATVEIVELAA